MLKLFFTKIAHAIVIGAIAVGSIFGIGQQAQFGATIPTTVSLFETSLASNIASTDTAMTLVSGTDRAGNTLSGYFCFLVDGGTTVQEFQCGTVNGTAVTAMVRGIDPQNPNTSVTALKFAHRRGADVKITDYPQLSILSRILNGTDTVPNVLSYNSEPTFTLGTQIIDKTYADSLSFAGAPNGSTSQKGIFQEATSAQINSGTLAGSTGADLVVNPSQLASSIYNSQLPTSGQKSALVGNNTDIAIGSGNTYVSQTGLQHGAENYITTTGSANAYVATLSPVPTSLTAGMALKLKANFSNTGSATLAVNGLGSTPAITKNGTQALVANDILNGQIFVVIWDGTEWQLQTPSTNLAIPITTFVAPFVKWNTKIAAGTTSNTFKSISQYTTATTGLSSTNNGYYVTRDNTTTAGFLMGRVGYEPTSGIRTLISTATASGTNTAGNDVGIAVVGSNVFVGHFENGGAFQVYRYSTTLGSEQLMTNSGTMPPNTANSYMFSDNTNLFIHNTASGDNYYEYSISGTTITNIATVTYTGIGASKPWSDGTNVWAIVSGVVTKWPIAGGASSATGITVPSSLDQFGGIAGIGGQNYLDVMWGDNNNNDLSTSSTVHSYLFLSMYPVPRP